MSGFERDFTNFYIINKEILDSVLFVNPYDFSPLGIDKIQSIAGTEGDRYVRFLRNDSQELILMFSDSDIQFMIDSLRSLIEG